MVAWNNARKEEKSMTDMAKLFAVALLMFVSVGCEGEDKNIKENGRNYLIVEIDGCEYVFYEVGYGAGLAHKGNCKNHKGGNHDR